MVDIIVRYSMSTVIISFITYLVVSSCRRLLFIYRLKKGPPKKYTLDLDLPYIFSKPTKYNKKAKRSYSLKRFLLFGVPYDGRI